MPNAHEQVNEICCQLFSTQYSVILFLLLTQFKMKLEISSPIIMYYLYKIYYCIISLVNIPHYRAYIIANVR